MENFKQKLILFLSSFSHATTTQLNMKEMSQYYDCSLQLLLVT